VIHTGRTIRLAAAIAVLVTSLHAQSATARGGAASIDVPTLKEWLTYIASDELQGRQVYTEGLGLAASYIAGHLERWGVRPAGEDSSYFQTVRVLGVRNDSRSSVTIEVNGQRRTFKDGEGILLPRNAGGRQTVRGDDVYFAGYGLRTSDPAVDDYAGVDVGGKVVVWLGPEGPEGAGAEVNRLLSARSRSAVDRGAIAAIGPPPPGRAGMTTAAAGARSGGRGGAASVDFTTAQRYDRPIPPVATAEDDFFEFLFSGSGLTYADLKARAERREPLPRQPLTGVTLTFQIDPEYTVVTTRLSRNVVGIVEGGDPQLKPSYVSFGAHYDHLGYRQTVPEGGGGGGGNFGCPGQTRPTPRPGDIVNNGADDDGSGTVALMGIARAFALGPRPRRSLLFIWHTGEESGLQGSRYNADHPVVPNEATIAHLNMDMIGRNRCDDPAQVDTVYLVGSDRISTELHNASEVVNAGMAKPLTLDYEMNDPADPQSIYTRSDHYSYAAKGIPVIFYTTGLHRDYHYLTDEIEKIEFDKMVRVARLIFLIGERLANLEQPPARDNRGPRAGRGTRGPLAP